MDGVLVQDAARRIGITDAQVRRLVLKGRIRVRKRIGGSLFLDHEDVEREAERWARIPDRLAGVERM